MNLLNKKLEQFDYELQDLAIRIAWSESSTYKQKWLESHKDIYNRIFHIYGDTLAEYLEEEWKVEEEQLSQLRHEYEEMDHLRDALKAEIESGRVH